LRCRVRPAGRKGMQHSPYLEYTGSVWKGKL